MKIIYAINIHSGGGKILLDELINGIDKPSEFILFLNEHYRLVPDKSIFKNVILVRSNIFDRLYAEFKLFSIEDNNNQILYFGNLPPLIKPKGFIVVFLQNRYLIDFVTLNSFSLKTIVRIWIERGLFFFQSKNVDEFVVQTQTMKQILIDHIGSFKTVKILPFAQVNNEQIGKYSLSSKNIDIAFSFVYPASGEPHKNHTNLIYAWIELANKSIFPTLYLTLDDSVFPNLVSWITEKSLQHNLKVINMGNLDKHELFDLYKQVNALIFASYFESFGLPLIESQEFGLPILAAELDFVRDIVTPVETFDPMSKTSISRALMRFMGNAVLTEKIRNGREFLSEIFT